MGAAAGLSRWLLGPRIEALDAVSKLRAQRLFGALTGAWVGTLFFGVLSSAVAFQPVYLATSAGLLALTYYLRRTARTGPATHGFALAIFALTGLITWRDGGFDGATFFWALIPPMLASRFMSSRTTLGWTLAVVALFTAVMFAQRSGWLPPSAVPDPMRVPLKYVSALIFLLLLVSQGHEQERQTRATMSELERLRGEAERANVAKTAFLANMSHELRTPLNGVVGFTQLLERSTLSGEQREYLNQMVKSCDVLLSLINDIIDVSRIEADSVTLEAAPVEVRGLVDAVAELLAERAHRKGLHLWVDVEADVPARVTGDSHRLRQVLMNLCINAIKFTSAGEVVMRVTCADGQLAFEVRDTGIGIPDEAQAKLFRPFFQVDASRTRRFGGSGLGLSITRGLVEKMGGRVEVFSAAPHGTVFVVRLPLSGETAPPAGLGRKVWVCGDEACLEPVRRRLQAHGCAVELVDEAAWRRACTPEAPDVYLAVNRAPAATGRWFLATDWVQRLRFVDAPAPQLWLPLSSAAIAALDAKPGEAATPAAEAALNLTVLMAEDNAVNQLVARGLLEALGCTVTVVSNGVEAVQRATSDAYDLILMDCHMPELDGIEATRVLRSRGVTTPVCALTAAVLADERTTCFDAGMTSFLTKPLRVDELRAVLATHAPVRHHP